MGDNEIQVDETQENRKSHTLMCCWAWLFSLWWTPVDLPLALTNHWLWAVFKTFSSLSYTLAILWFILYVKKTYKNPPSLLCMFATSLLFFCTEMKFSLRFFVVCSLQFICCVSTLG